MAHLFENEGELNIPRTGNVLVPGCGRVSPNVHGSISWAVLMTIILLKYRETMWSSSGNEAITPWESNRPQPQFKLLAS